jgi:hypothetical protein
VTAPRPRRARPPAVRWNRTADGTHYETRPARVAGCDLRLDRARSFTTGKWGQWDTSCTAGKWWCRTWIKSERGAKRAAVEMARRLAR